MGDVVVGIQRAQGTPYPAWNKCEEVRNLVLDVKISKDDDELYERSTHLEATGANEKGRRLIASDISVFETLECKPSSNAGGYSAAKNKTTAEVSIGPLFGTWNLAFSLNKWSIRKKVILSVTLDCCYAGGSLRYKIGDYTGIQQQNNAVEAHEEDWIGRDLFTSVAKGSPKAMYWYWKDRNYNVIAAYQPRQTAREEHSKPRHTTLFLMIQARTQSYDYDSPQSPVQFGELKNHVFGLGRGLINTQDVFMVTEVCLETEESEETPTVELSIGTVDNVAVGDIYELMPFIGAEYTTKVDIVNSKAKRYSAFRDLRPEPREFGDISWDFDIQAKGARSTIPERRKGKEKVGLATISFKNNTGQKVYIAVFNLAPDWSITQLIPNKSEGLLPVNDGSKIPAHSLDIMVPEPIKGKDRPKTMTEVFKLIVSTNQIPQADCLGC
ncbi:hypothetical protein OPT61_g9552 [Boeremia exigua]|uniref:Uncharacterized protein n=1 Tax=Boeremia exigua TaxID=749465 RepID=A0ACC2HU89_9PLEO|nr:hypothetical protein OPT61_g9552 [Boeremia exigua]